MAKENANSFPNTTQDFEGLSIDILEEMKKKLKFNYRIYVVPDDKFGVRDRNTLEWNGIVAEIINKVFLQKKLSDFKMFLNVYNLFFGDDVSVS